ncbi:right-handed parallel beta-helix repeat-containing protein [Candidatus Fermentibacteria bacterium]|nr:right-handed parallel beta-helix repeat-containing protein [Candidatus Fermentibacteria bacterium]
MRSLAFTLSIISVLLHGNAVADDYVECGFPEDEETRHGWIEIDVYDLFEGIWADTIRAELDADINLFVEDSLIWMYDETLLDDAHLRTFIEQIWFPDGNDIREIWNYFASGPIRPVYGDPSYDPYNSNFRYPSGATDVDIKLRDHLYSTAGGNDVTLNIMYPSPVPPLYKAIPDDWPIGNRAPRTFCHELQHTIRSHFDYNEFDHGFFEELFAEGAVVAAGRSRTNVGADHEDATWYRYDLVANNSIARVEAGTYPLGVWDQQHEYQTCKTKNSTTKYWVFYLWSRYIFDHFPGAEPQAIDDDLLYKAVRAEEDGSPVRGFYGFLKAAEDHWAWGTTGGDLFRQIFNAWTLANLLDGTGFDPKYEYPNDNVRIREPGQAGLGWLRDNEDNTYNNLPDLPDFVCGSAATDSMSGAWTPDTTVVSQPGSIYEFRRDGPGYGSEPIGIEIYAADYTRWVSAVPPGDWILSMSFDVHDEDNWGSSDNILIQANVVGYSGGENNPTNVWHIDMAQSSFPAYSERLYHHVPGFGSSIDLVDVVVNAMESEVRWGRPSGSGYVHCSYPMRSYAITATAVSATLPVSGTITETTIWFSGQTVLIPQGTVLTVASGADLIIQPGVTVVLGGGSSIGVSGGLVARGNGSLPVTFTASAHTPGAWSRIYTAGPSSVLDLEHCIIEYADKGVLVSHSGSHVIEDNTFRECNYGVYLDGVTLTEFRGNSFDGNVVGMYMNQSWISNSDGFRDLTFVDNDVGLKAETPSGGTSILAYSNFSGNADCAIYYNRNTGAGDLELQDLFIVDQTPVLNAGIRVLGSNSQPVVRHCNIHDFAGGPLGPNIGISCRAGGRVDAGTSGDHGLNLFADNECDIEYTSRYANPPGLSALGNCWDGLGGQASRCGSFWYLIFTSEDCSAWGGSPVPPRPAEETVAGLRGVFPNPAEGSFRIEYGMSLGARVKVQIYDLSGRLVRTVVETEMPVGTHEAEWDGTDAQGRTVGRGVYVCRIVSESFVESKRLVVMR